MFSFLLESVFNSGIMVKTKLQNYFEHAKLQNHIIELN